MNKPMPGITPTSKPLWDGYNQERLVIQRCAADDCHKYVYYPRVACPHCHRDTLRWQEVSGYGTVISHTTIHRSHHEAFAPLVPYVFAAVRLDEGPLVYARLRKAAASTNLMNYRVRATYEPMTEEQNILTFCVVET